MKELEPSLQNVFQKRQNCFIRRFLNWVLESDVFVGREVNIEEAF